MFYFKIVDKFLKYKTPEGPISSSLNSLWLFQINYSHNHCLQAMHINKNALQSHGNAKHTYKIV